MKKIIRPTGLIGFLAVVGLIAAIGWLLSGWLLKTAVEQGGSRLIGAKVELADASTQLNPLGFTLSGLQVTDPDQPMRNLVEFDSISGQLKLGRLLMGQVIIEDLQALGLRLDTPRSISGKLDRPAEPTVSEPKSESDEGSDLLALTQDSINVDEILAREPLATLEQGKIFKARSQQIQQQVSDDIAALPSADSLQVYEQEVNAITSGEIQSLDDINQRIEKLKQLKQTLKQDRVAIVELRESVGEARRDLKDQFAELKQAPQKDLAMIQDKYSLEGGNIGNFAQLLFGENIQQWIDKLRPWWDRSQEIAQSFQGDDEPPAPARGEGRFIHFATLEALPDFLIEKARLTAELPAGQFDVHMFDATHQPALLGRPTRIEAKGIELAQMQSFTASAVLDRTDPRTAIDSIDWNIQQLQIEQLELVKHDQYPVNLARADSQIEGQLKVVDGTLDGRVHSLFDQADWAGKGDKKSSLLELLSAIDSFNIDTKIAGNIRLPKLAMDSDLDKKLSKAFNQKIAEKRQALKTKLEQRLKAEVDKLAGAYEEQLAAITQTEGNIKQRLAKIEAMLKTEVDSAVAAQREEIEHRIALEKQRAQEKLDQEKRAAEEKLRQEEQKARDLAAQKEQAARDKAAREEQAAKEKAEREKQEAADELKKKAEDKLKNLRF